DADLEVVPLAGRGGGVSKPFYPGPPAFFGFSQKEIVFPRNCAHGGIVARRLYGEKEFSALIHAAGKAVEAPREVSLSASRNVFGDDIREIRIGLNPVEEFGIAVAVKRARLVGDAGGGLSLFPLPAIDDQHFVVAVALDPPDADDAHERFRLGADGLIRKVDLERLRRVGAQQQCRKAEACNSRHDRPFSDPHWLTSIFNKSIRQASSLTFPLAVSAKLLEIAPQIREFLLVLDG